PPDSGTKRPKSSNGRIPFSHAGFGLTRHPGSAHCYAQAIAPSRVLDVFFRTGLAAHRIGLRFTLTVRRDDMHLRYRSVLPLVAICTALAVAPAFAAKTAPTTLSNQPASQVSQQSVLPCQLGIFSAPNSAYGYILPPDDGYYTLLNPAQCQDCPPGTPLRLLTAHVA